MTQSETAPSKNRALGLIALGQLLALSLWFSASAVAPQLQDEWTLDIGQVAGLTLMVQIGFVVGALLSALFNVADIVASRRLFFISAMAGASANLGLLAVTSESVGVGMVLRFLTGLFLAGVYPAGLKVMAGWFKEGRGLALGVLVGALTVGSASPHLVRGIGLDWRGVVVSASVLTVIAAYMMTRVGDGPYDTAGQRFRWSHISDVVANRGVRLSTYGYLGHMWELYAMWTWSAAFLVASAENAGSNYGSIPILTFLVIAIGGLGSFWAGSLADRHGRTKIAGGAMAISGTCALLTPLVFGSRVWIVLPLMMLWGLTVVADSAQFSAMVTETAQDAVRGTALTLQTAVGFLLTLVTIRWVPSLAESFGWKWAFPVLALGPALGVLAMLRLKRSSIAIQLAGGRG